MGSRAAADPAAARQEDGHPVPRPGQVRAAGRALVLRPRGRHGTPGLPRRRVLRAAAGAGRPFGGRQVIAAARGPAAAPQRAGRGSPGNRRAGDRARAHGHPGRRPQGPAHRARGEPGRRRRRTPGGHRGPVRGGLHPVPRRGAAPRLHHRAVRTGRDRLGDPRAAGRLLRPGDPLPGAGERAGVPAGRAQPDDGGPGPPRRHRARPAGQGGRRRRPRRPAARRPGAAGRERARRGRRRTWRPRRPRRTWRARRRVRAGRAAAAVARHAGHLGTQPRRHAGDRRLPGERRDQGRPHADGGARLRQPDAGPAAARQAAVPSPGAATPKPCSPRSSTSG